jgi:hypothetical protein
MDAEYRAFENDRPKPDENGRVPIKAEDWKAVKASLQTASKEWEAAQRRAAESGDADTRDDSPTDR